MRNVLLQLIFISSAVCLFVCCKNKIGKLPLSLKGVTVYDSTRTEAGLTLVDNGSWQSSLVDMRGNTKKIFPVGLVDIHPDGNIVGRLDSFLVKFDSAMNIIWKTEVQLNIHHAISSDEAGNIYLLSSDAHQFMGLKVRFDVVNIFSPDGTLIYKWCVYDHLEEFVFIISKSAWLKHLPLSYAQSSSVEEYIKQYMEMFITPTIKHYPQNSNFEFEFTRFTSIEVLPENTVSEKIPAFKKGNLLLSFNPYSCYGILDTASGKIEWAGYLPERTTLHSPTLTSDGTILVFQNSTDSIDWTSKEEYDSSREIFLKIILYQIPAQKPEPRLWTSITEYDPFSNKKVWEYTAEQKASIQAWQMGSAQHLPNGNTLICMTTKEKGGRIFELTRQKEIVWNYSSTEVNPENGQPINLYRAKRISLGMLEKMSQ